MARMAKRKHPQQNEKIDVTNFKDIQVRFPGDAYILAVWMAMSDRAKSTPTCQPHTTLHGLACNFAILHGTDYSNPLNSEDVMSVFRSHGISGNPLLHLETTDELLVQPSMLEAAGLRTAIQSPAAPRIAEPNDAPERE